jgi:urease accessory protein
MSPGVDVVDRSSARSSSWRAHLALRFAHDGTRTWLAERRHEGPLVVQKPLYPEGRDVCHAIVVHPPGGMANGDELDIAIDAGDRAHAQLTTPGAAKWYRCAHAPARQALHVRAAAGAIVEWLPQGTIVFDGALAWLTTRIDLAADAIFIGWDIACLGRTAAGERFASGTYRQSTEIHRDGALIWSERMNLRAGARMMESAVGLNGNPVFGTFVACVPQVGDETLELARRVHTDAGDGVVTRLPGVLLARFVGARSEHAMVYFVALWSAVRPRLVGRAAVQPRIWQT